MSFPSHKKYRHYPLETKLKVIFAKKEGLADKTIQAKFKIKNRSQIADWCLWFDQNQIHRLQYPRTPLNFHHPQYLLIQKEIQAKLKAHLQPNKTFYLTLIREYQTKIPLATLLQWLNIAKTSYYRWLKQKKQPSSLTPLEKEITKICEQNKYINLEQKSFYLLGYRKVFISLLKANFKVNLKTVYQKMKQFGLLCQTLKNRYLKKRKLNTYFPLEKTNLIQNNFTAGAPYRKICADFTYLPYNQDKVIYLSCIMDLYNREIISYQISTKCDQHLVLKTLFRLPILPPNCIFHSDQGTQYTAKECQKFLKKNHFQPSFSEKSQPAQNACIEAFFSTLKCEFFYFEPKKVLTKKYLIKKIKTFIQKYNQQRKLKYLNYLNPLEFKAKNALR